MDIIIDIETAPLEFGKYLYKDERTGEEKDIGALSPITGRITALGLKYNDIENIFISEDEGEMLNEFWRSIENLHMKEKAPIRFVGFGIKKFDMHFLYVRSLANNVKIYRVYAPSVIDLKEYLTFFNSYKKRGKLSDYAHLIGIGGKYKDITGEQVPFLWKDKRLDELKAYLSNDLRMTQDIFLKCKELGILT